MPASITSAIISTDTWRSPPAARLFDERRERLDESANPCCSSGSSTRNAPRPSSLSTRTSPLCSWTTRFTIARPSLKARDPLAPFGLDAVETVEDALDLVGRDPGPWSSTTIRTWSPPRTP